MYEGLFLRAVVGFESFCETLFFEILDGKLEYSSRKIECKIKCKSMSKKSLRELVFQGKYFDWLSLQKNKERFLWYVSKRGRTPICGRPFLEVDESHNGKLKTIVRIRNAITHSSDHAIGEFNRKVLNQNLLPNERTPASFLRSQISNSPRQVRFETYLGDLGSIATVIFGSPHRTS